MGGHLSIATDSASVQIGIITDIQYANTPDKKIMFQGKERTRYFSNVLSKLKIAVQFFNQRQVPCVIHLGDIIHGYKEDAEGKGVADLEAVKRELGGLKAPIYHVVGNHCFKAGGRQRLLESLNIKINNSNINSTDSWNCYRSVSLSPKWRMIILDSLALSLFNPASPALYDEAVKYSENHAEEFGGWYFKQGGLGSEQTQWLKDQLKECRNKEINVIVCLHHPVSRETCPYRHALWNDWELHAIISEFSGTVRAVFSGHYHQGGYSLEKGVHYVVLESILDSKHPSGSHGIVTLHDNRIDIEGHGDMTSRTLKF